MIFQKLESSNIAAAGYDATTSTMGVLFQGGAYTFTPAWRSGLMMHSLLLSR